MKITGTKLQIAADSDAIRKTLSPLVQGTLESIHALHIDDRTPGKMTQLRDEFIFHATAADLAKVDGIKMKVKVYINRVCLINEGYDRFGTYWGEGDPLYHYETDWEDTDNKPVYVSDYIRADSKDHAKIKVSKILRLTHPEIHFEF